MILQKDNCTICLDPISNPICRSCHIQEIESWMKDLKIDYSKRRKITNLIREKIPSEPSETNSTCIICKKNEINVCSYCLFYVSLRVLLENNFRQEIIEDFLETFNYQLGYERYSI